jgi:hypothetical protein
VPLRALCVLCGESLQAGKKKSPVASGAPGIHRR